MTDGVLLDFSDMNHLWQDANGWRPVFAAGQYIGRADDLKSVGVAHPASSATVGARRRINENFWGFLNASERGDEIFVEFPDLGSDCSIISVTPAGVSIQLHQAISGIHVLPHHVLKYYCIVDRPLTGDEIAAVKSQYGGVYAICYDQTIDGRAQSGTTYHTADLGWIANTDVGASGQMQSLINSLANGDTVIFDAMYKISGIYNLSALSNITFQAAVKQACGFDCLDGVLELATANGLSHRVERLFLVGGGFLADGLYCTQGAIDTQQIGDGKEAWFKAENVDKFYAVDCKFDTPGWGSIYLFNVPDAVVARCAFKDTRTGIGLNAACDNIVIAHNYFTGGYEFLYDGVKTVFDYYTSRGPENPVYVENVVEDVVRDAIDTTGGFKNGIVSANVFRNCEYTAMDIKSQYDSSARVAAGAIGNTNISISYNFMSENNGNGLVLTTWWTAEDTPDPTLAVGPIYSYRNVYWDEALRHPVGRIFLNKNSPGILSTQDTFHKLLQLIGEYGADYYGLPLPSLLTPSVFNDAKVL